MKLLSNQLCDYPNKTLSGVGIVYKLCQYFDKIAGEDIAENYLDLVALGLVGDVMDMRPRETKRLIEKGIRDINNPFIEQMRKKNAYSLGEQLTPIGLAFYIAPYINATIRMGTQDEKMLLFDSLLDYKNETEIPSTKRGHAADETESIAEQACRVCGNVKNHQTKARDYGLEIAEKVIQENNLLDKKILIIRLPEDSDCDRNLTGLIANVLMDKYQRPVLLLNHSVKNGEVFWTGSGRGYNKCVLNDFRGFLEQIGVRDWGGYAQGHPLAFGVSIPEKHMDELIQKSEELLKDFDFSPTYKVDRIYHQLTNSDYQDLDRICRLSNIWGQGVEEPKFAFENIKPEEIVLMSPEKNPTLKLTLPTGLKCIKFKATEEEYKKLTEGSPWTTIKLNIVGRCEKNEWNHKITPQIIIEDYEIASVEAYAF